MAEMRIKSRPDIKNSYSYPLHHTSPQEPGIMVEKDISISAFFLHQIPVLKMFMQHLIKTEMEAAEINPNLQNKRISA